MIVNFSTGEYKQVEFYETTKHREPCHFYPKNEEGEYMGPVISDTADVPDEVMERYYEALETLKQAEEEVLQYIPESMKYLL